MFSASQTTVGQRVVNYLNEQGLKASGSARLNTPGTDQRHNMIYASTVDLEEAYRLGQKAVLIAMDGKNGLMSTILRDPGLIYNVRYDAVSLEQVANSERQFPQEWIADNKVDVTDEFVRYAQPLIGQHWVSIPLVNGLQRFAQLQPVFAPQNLPAYTPQGYR